MHVGERKALQNKLMSISMLSEYLYVSILSLGLKTGIQQQLKSS